MARLKAAKKASKSGGKKKKTTSKKDGMAKKVKATRKSSSSSDSKQQKMVVRSPNGDKKMTLRADDKGLMTLLHIRPAQRKVVGEVAQAFLDDKITPRKVRTLIRKGEGVSKAKKEPTGYILWARDEGRAMLPENLQGKNATIGEKGKALGEMWRGLSPAKKSKYLKQE